MSTKSQRTTRVRKPKQLPDFEYGDNTQHNSEGRSLRSRSSLTTKAKKEDKNTSNKTVANSDKPPVIEAQNSGHVNISPKSKRSMKGPGKKPIEQRLAQEEARKGRPRKSVRVSMKGLSALDVVPMDVLVTVPPAMLVDLFSTLTSDEITRQFTYKCLLIPTKCKQTYKSFGNELKARQNMQRHLHQHVNTLVEDSKDPSKASKIKFTAETVPAKKRRLMELSEETKPSSPSPHVSADERSPVEDSESEAEEGKILEKKAAKKRSRSKPVLPQQPATSSQLDVMATAPPKRIRVKIKKSAVKTKESDVSIGEVEEIDVGGGSDTEEMMRKNAKLIEEMNAKARLEKLQNSDHSYAQIYNGKTYVRPPPYYHKDDDEEELLKLAPGKLAYTLRNRTEWFPKSESPNLDSDVDHDLACHFGVMGARLKTGFVLAHGDMNIPIMQLVQVPRRQWAAPSVGEEVTIEQPKNLRTRREKGMVTTKGCIVEDSSDEESILTTQSHRPYPPMPKFQPEMGTKLVIPEEEMALGMSDGEEEDPAEEGKELTDAEKEKKLAIKCMRELKSQKGRRFSSVVCKICQKLFTATATLMYHYRSHANIKPFICLLCNATFTRQHSLNYHMLIHNGQSRFRCPDCGRAFRHPSHYKEHRRRHTGETPFGCSDCPRRFKTRNTYKRHMATAHKKGVSKDEKEDPIVDEDEDIEDEESLSDNGPDEELADDISQGKSKENTPIKAQECSDKPVLPQGYNQQFNIASGLIMKLAKQSAREGALPDNPGKDEQDVQIEDDDDDGTSLLCLENQTPL